jgi:endonuclease YncB( thermonuclease family)
MGRVPSIRTRGRPFSSPLQTLLGVAFLIASCLFVVPVLAGRLNFVGRIDSLLNGVTLLGMRSECEVIIDASPKITVRLTDIEPIPIGDGVDHQQVLEWISSFVFNLKTSNTFRVSLKDDGTTGDNVRRGTIWTSGSRTSLQQLLVRDGYAKPSATSNRHLLAACDLAMQERRGLWMLAKPWPTEFAWWTKYVQDNVTSNTFDAATAPQVDLIVLIGHRRRGSSFYPLAPFVITRDHMVKSSDLPGLSNHGFTIASDALVDHICGHVSPTNTFRSETWAAVLSSSNHVIRGYAAFGADLWDKAPATGNESVTNMIRFIPQYLDTAK